MSEALEFPDIEASASFKGGRVDTSTAAGILVAAALATLIGLRVTFPKPR
jgi:hypothetical protein